jgi:hypothetical protein
MVVFVQARLSRQREAFDEAGVGIGIPAFDIAGTEARAKETTSGELS